MSGVGGANTMSSGLIGGGAPRSPRSIVSQSRSSGNITLSSGSPTRSIQAMKSEFGPHAGASIPAPITHATESSAETRTSENPSAV